METKISYHKTKSIEELKEILQLQKENLPDFLDEKVKENEGFVTIVHDLEILKLMQSKCPHIIAKKDNKIIGYALSMTKDFKDNIPALIPMFNQLNKTMYAKSNYIIMGQICIAKKYRGQGVFRGLYNHMKKELSFKYDVIITEINIKNRRSINAHHYIGFNDLITYEEKNIDWKIVSLTI